MRYKELIHFDPITSVVKLPEAGQKAMAETLVRTFVFSSKIKEDLTLAVLKNLHVQARYETKGIQIVGGYGTGKSHLMSLVSAVAEDAELLPLISDAAVRDAFEPIAGQYKVLRFELGTNRPLDEIMAAHIQRFLDRIGIAFAMEKSPTFGWKEQLNHLMAAFEEQFPDKHFLIAMDEFLEYLQSRNPTELSNDLMLLRQLGEACDNSRFKLMFGVQELLYRSPSFQHQAEMLNKIEDRYDDLIITKEDVSYVVKERLLKKDVHQKNAIRQHLLHFAHLFDGINGDLNEYIDMFPVHPNFVGYFERIKHGKNQREILKILSATFQKIQDKDVPTDNPGLITYNQYWPELSGNPSMLTFPDIRTVKDKMDIISDRIQGHFTAGRAGKRSLAESIAHALAIRILCDDLDKRNGATAQSLKEDLCQTLSGVDDPDLLTANVESTAKQLVSATSGQYVDQDPVSGEFYLRTEGGVNILQVIRDYANEVIRPDPNIADQYFFDLLKYALGLSFETYRTGFNIWPHSLEWIERKSFRLGYIFFGNPNERSTTEPVQQYYLFFLPLFGEKHRDDAPDEVYFDFSGISAEFQDMILLYAAAKAKEGAAASNQKVLFRQHLEDYRQKVLAQFDREFADKVEVWYGGISKTMKSFPLPGEGATKDTIFSQVAARLLNRHFSEKFPDYPAFRDLLQPLSKDNFDGRMRSALKKIANPNAPNRDGEAILAGLGLWNGQSLDTQHSKYAGSLMLKLQEKGPGKVLNRDEIIEPHYAPANLWYSRDFKLDHPLEFLVLAVLCYKGDLEIIWSPGKVLSATQIEMLNNLAEEDFFTYQHVKAPQGLPVKHIKALFSCLGLPDLSSELEKPETITRILTEAKIRVERVVKTRALVAAGLRCRSIPLLSEVESAHIKAGLDGLAALLDGVQAYNSYGKLKAFKYTEQELLEQFKAFAYCDQVELLGERAGKFEKLITYLYTAQSYVVESEKPLYNDMGAAIQRLGPVLLSGKDVEIKQYEALLKSLVDQYADYYLGQYAKCRLSRTDALTKDRLLNSEAKRVCDIIRDAEFITPTEYNKWIETLSALKPADPDLNKKRLLEEPYHDFHPREFYGKPHYKMDELEEQLQTILDNWAQAMRSVFKDPSVQSNLLELATPDDKRLAEQFRDGDIELDGQNAARLRDLIRDLSQGIDKVEIAWDDLRRRLNRPMTPQEAIDSLTQYINGLCAGKERNKVRILLK